MMDIDTIVAERTGVLGLAREQGRQIEGLVERGRLTAAEATLLKRFLSGFADSVATGLHRSGDDPAAVRELMRANVLAPPP